MMNTEARIVTLPTYDSFRGKPCYRNYNSSFEEARFSHYRDSKKTQQLLNIIRNAAIKIKELQDPNSSNKISISVRINNDNNKNGGVRAFGSTQTREKCTFSQHYLAEYPSQATFVFSLADEEWCGNASTKKLSFEAAPSGADTFGNGVFRQAVFSFGARNFTKDRPFAEPIRAPNLLENAQNPFNIYNREIPSTVMEDVCSSLNPQNFNMGSSPLRACQSNLLTRPSTSQVSQNQTFQSPFVHWTIPNVSTSTPKQAQWQPLCEGIQPPQNKSFPKQNPGKTPRKVEVPEMLKDLAKEMRKWRLDRKDRKEEIEDWRTEREGFKKEMEEWRTEREEFQKVIKHLEEEINQTDSAEGEKESEREQAAEDKIKSVEGNNEDNVIIQGVEITIPDQNRIEIKEEKAEDEEEMQIPDQNKISFKEEIKTEPLESEEGETQDDIVVIQGVEIKIPDQNRIEIKEEKAEDEEEMQIPDRNKISNKEDIKTEPLESVEGEIQDDFVVIQGVEIKIPDQNLCTSD